MGNYFLAKHAFVCAIGQDVIVLDLKHDKYLAFDREFWEPIAKTIGGWPITATSDLAEEQIPDETALAQLIDSGLLTEDSRQGKDASPPEMAIPSASMLEDFNAQVPPLRTRDVVTFLRAIFISIIRLRCQALEKIAAGIVRKRQQSRQAPDPALVRDLTAIFRRLRPLLFASRDHCLFESLTLLQFLSYYGIHPTWAFGVRTAPFAAHCWLQIDGTACNDTLDHIRRFTPIMLI